MLCCISTMISLPLWICPCSICITRHLISCAPGNRELWPFIYRCRNRTLEWQWFRSIRWWLDGWFRPIPCLNTFLLRHPLSICDINSNLCLSPKAPSFDWPWLQLKQFETFKMWWGLSWGLEVLQGTHGPAFQVGVKEKMAGSCEQGCVYFSIKKHSCPKTTIAMPSLRIITECEPLNLQACLKHT